MITVKPDFYDLFFCKADKCTDTCCAGWEVDIDADSLKMYRQVKGDFGEKLNENIIKTEHCHCFRLSEGDVCPFLDKKGLCEIYRNLGADALCEICREHPRFYECLDGRTETGLGLCCEKVCELLLSSDTSLSFIEEFDGGTTDSDTEELAFARKELFALLSDRTVSLRERVALLLVKGADLQFRYFGDSIFRKSQIPELYERVVQIIANTEPLNEQWTEYIEDLQNYLPNIKRIMAQCPIKESDFERFLTYLLYRYFMKSLYDGNLAGHIAFCTVSLCFLYLENAYTFYRTEKLTHRDKINNIKLFSKQIEYSEENVASVTQSAFDLFYQDE